MLLCVLSPYFVRAATNNPSCVAACAKLSVAGSVVVCSKSILCEGYYIQLRVRFCRSAVERCMQCCCVFYVHTLCGHPHTAQRAFLRVRRGALYAGLFCVLSPNLSLIHI